MGSSLFVEKRIHSRVAIQIPVKFRLIEDPVGIDSISDLRKKEVVTKTMDVSLGGMFIATDEKLNVGTIMNLNFSLPENPGNRSAFAEVVWSNDNGGGIHFLALKEEDLHSLKDTLTKMSSGRKSA